MNARLTMIAALFLAVAGAAHGHDCSGGTEGGTDATGNQCNDAVPAAAAPATSTATRSDAKPARPAAARGARNTAPARTERLARNAAGPGR